MLVLEIALDAPPLASRFLLLYLEVALRLLALLLRIALTDFEIALCTLSFELRLPLTALQLALQAALPRLIRRTIIRCRGLRGRAFPGRVVFQA